MDVYEKLREAGLTGNESRVYNELSTKGQLSANEVAKALSMDRTLSYTVLNHLIEKGLATYHIKSNKKYFEATNPENLLNSVRKKEFVITDLIKDLNKIKKTTNSPFEINIYEGKEGLRSWMNIAMSHKEFLSIGATGRAFYELYELQAFSKTIKKNQFNVRIIGNKEYAGTEAFNLPYIEYGYLKEKSEATTSVFGEYISIHLIKGKPFIILIKNKEIAQSYRNYFEVLWRSAKKYKARKT